MVRYTKIFDSKQISYLSGCQLYVTSFKIVYVSSKLLSGSNL